MQGRKGHRALQLATLSCPLFYIYIIYMYVFVYDFFYHKYGAQRGPGSGGGLGCWSFLTWE